MSLQGTSFLCIWNDHDPAQAVEYEAWHTFEHVPERVCVPGFLSGRRYASYDRTESRYFTLYDIASSAVLETPAYQDLLDNPTEWSHKMRHAFCNFLRIPCSTLASKGIGCANAMGVLVFSARKGADEAVSILQARLERLMSDYHITAFHLGCASKIPAYAVFGAKEQDDDNSDTYVVMVEALFVSDTEDALATLAPLVTDTFEQLLLIKQESSGLLFKIDADELVGSSLRRDVS